MAQIFLSYSHSDSKFVKLIEPRIARIFGEGVLWFDRKPDGLKGGQIWWNEILREIQNCQIFLFLLSDESAESEWCTKELEEAAHLHKTIIPVLLETYSSKEYPGHYSELTQHRLQETQYVDLRTEGRYKYDDLSPLWGSINRAQQPSLTPVERWILHNQYEIMMMNLEQDSESKKSIIFEFLQVLQDGYEYEFKEIMQSFEHVVSHNDCQEVLEILDMFQAIHWAINRVDGVLPAVEAVDVSDIEKSRIAFQGFDGNHEPAQHLYAKYNFSVKDHRYSKHILPDDGRLNSGRPMLEQYRLMLKAWKKSPKKRLLTREDILRIADAAIPPHLKS